MNITTRDAANEAKSKLDAAVKQMVHFATQLETAGYCVEIHIPHNFDFRFRDLVSQTTPQVFVYREIKEEL